MATQIPLRFAHLVVQIGQYLTNIKHCSIQIIVILYHTDTEDNNNVPRVW